MGNPLRFENTVTAGIISGLGRAVPGAAQEAPALIDLMQTDAAISPGNSGGALVAADGRVAGINVAYIPPSAGAESLGFAIPAGDVLIRAADRPLATVEDFLTALRTRSPGESLQVTLSRGGEEQTVTVRLGERP